MPLSSSLDVAASPDVVTFHFHVRHDGTDSVEVRFRSAKFADLAVLDSGEEVWRWSDGQLFTQMMQTETFDPGQTETFEFEWPDPDSGEYEAVATLNTDEDVEARAEFSV